MTLAAAMSTAQPAVAAEIPSLDGVRKCVVNADVINNRSRPFLLTENEEPIPYAETA